MLQSVIMFDTSNVERFAQYAVSPHLNTEESPPYHVLFRMGNLRTLTLTECHSLGLTPGHASVHDVLSRVQHVR